MPPDLAEQIPWVHEACEALGVPILTFERFEADDVIGTLARQAVAAGFEVAIVTGDKDFFQLVGAGIKVYNPKDEGTWYDEAGVAEKFGVTPAQVVDVLALMGDAIDNIKGVPGIGEKGAQELIGVYGSLDALLARAAEVPQKRYREALVAHAEAARQSRELARIRTDVPVTFDPEALRYRGASRERAFALFSALGFRTIVTEFAPTADTVGHDYALVRTRAELDRLAADLVRAGRFGLRVLTDGRPPLVARRGRPRVLDRARSRRATCAVGHSGLDAATEFGPADALARLKPILEDPAVRKVSHDAKHDALVLARHGVTLAGLEADTMLLAYVLDANRSSQTLEDLALEHLGYKALAEDAVRGRGAKALGFDQLPLDAALDFAGERADLPLQLAGALRPLVDREGLGAVYDELEQPLVPVLVGDRAGGRAPRHGRARGAVAPARAGPRRAHAAHLRAGRRRVQHQLAEAALGGALREAAAARRQAHRQDAHGVDRRGRARGARARARAAARDPRVAQPAEAEGHLPRRPAPAREPRDRAPAHDVQPGGGGHRPAQQQRPEPAEHPGPHRARARDPRRVRRRARARC